VVSAIARAVELLGQSAQAGTRAGEHISGADAHARTVLQLYTDAAEESGHDAPHSARRQVSDAQECLLEAANRLHEGAQALSDYAHDIAPNLAGGVTSGTEFRPTGHDLLEMPAPDRTPRARRATRHLVRRLDDVADASQKVVDMAESGTSAFRQLPEQPGPAASVTRQRPPDAPAARANDVGAPTGGLFDAAVVISVVLAGGRQFWRRTVQMFKARPGDGTS
jgi:hypothetical protein